MKNDSKFKISLTLTKGFSLEAPVNDKLKSALSVAIIIFGGLTWVINAIAPNGLF
jgi:hypothetical protein